ncbi:MAG: hypothetical protein D6689_21985 [Deltaproteobacteria bacterium]|nr:MAG: hypothetical protein D6689_21985 [Deltaproteobacteria bacterium]
MRNRQLAWVALALTAAVAPAAARAQDGSTDDDPLAGAAGAGTGGDEVEMAPDDALDEGEPATLLDEGDAPAGAEEDPGAPVLHAERRAAAGDGSPATRAGGDRMLLPAGGWRVRYWAGIGGLTEKRAYPKRADDSDELSYLRAGGVLEADYGITDRLQVGLRYGTGTYGKVETAPDPNPSAEYVPGKAVAVDLRYGLTPWMALQIQLPMLLDPFEAAVTVGVPIRVRVGDRLALFAGEDLLTVRVTDMVPFVEDAVSNERSVVALDQTNAEKDDGDVTVKAGAIVRLDDRMAVRGTIGVVAGDFAMTDAGTPLWGDLLYAVSGHVGIEARVGFANLGAATKTFTAAVGVAVQH